jgi:hypothetical protein
LIYTPFLKFEALFCLISCRGFSRTAPIDLFYLKDTGEACLAPTLDFRNGMGEEHLTPTPDFLKGTGKTRLIPTTFLFLIRENSSKLCFGVTRPGQVVGATGWSPMGWG